MEQVGILVKHFRATSPCLQRSAAYFLEVGQLIFGRYVPLTDTTDMCMSMMPSSTTELECHMEWNTDAFCLEKSALTSFRLYCHDTCIAEGIADFEEVGDGESYVKLSKAGHGDSLASSSCTAEEYGWLTVELWTFEEASEDEEPDDVRRPTAGQEMMRELEALYGHLPMLHDRRSSHSRSARPASSSKAPHRVQGKVHPYHHEMLMSVPEEEEDAEVEAEGNADEKSKEDASQKAEEEVEEEELIEEKAEEGIEVDSEEEEEEEQKAEKCSESVSCTPDRSSSFASLVFFLN